MIKPFGHPLYGTVRGWLLFSPRDIGGLYRQAVLGGVGIFQVIGRWKLHKVPVHEEMV